MYKDLFIILCILSTIFVIDAKKTSKYEEDFEFIDEVRALNIKIYPNYINFAMWTSEKIPE